MLPRVRGENPDLPSKQSAAEHYQSDVAKELTDRWPEEGSVESQWTAVRDAVVTSAMDNLGPRKRRQSDWFADSQDVIQPLLDERNAM